MNKGASGTPACPTCKGARWVGEEHRRPCGIPNRSCTCGGAGAPCPHRNVGSFLPDLQLAAAMESATEPVQRPPPTGLQMVLQALDDAPLILVAYIAPGKRDPVDTVNALLAGLDRQSAPSTGCARSAVCIWSLTSLCRIRRAATRRTTIDGPRREARRHIAHTDCRPGTIKSTLSFIESQLAGTLQFLRRNRWQSYTSITNTLNYDSGVGTARECRRLLPRQVISALRPVSE
jgi:hypothetical protein